MTPLPQQKQSQTPGPLTDPDALQRRAAEPGACVWVAASAGSGKTKVLTDRVLRLLLPREGETDGTAPERILCLTFTKAGAAEMAVRIQKALARWAVMGEFDLHDDMKKLLGRPPTAPETEAARRLFARVIDAPGGLKILTLHSFCQSVLGRFPVEAGIAPHFKTADERSIKPMQQRALEAVLAEGARNPDLPLAAAIEALSHEKGEEDLTALLQHLMAERSRLRFMLRHYRDLAGIESALAEALGVRAGETPDSALAQCCADPSRDEGGLRALLQAITDHGTATLQDKALPVQQFLEAGAANRPGLWPGYVNFFLTKGEPRKKILVKAVIDAMHGADEIVQQEAQRILDLQARLKSVRCLNRTHHLLVLGLAVLDRYTAEKAARGVLDYDDLILHTLDLLSGDDRGTARAWVRYKLDRGIDHILVDEAQDTNPEQWDIVHALAEEFFSGESTRPAGARSIFAVGDEKQSIFGFQRAAPEKFRAAEDFYRAQSEQAGMRFDPVAMQISFRSVAPVLALTDSVFSQNSPDALGLPPGTAVQHISHRAGQAGRVELWPLIETAPPAPPEPWAPPVDIVAAAGPQSRLARDIAERIRGWIDHEILESKGRKIRPGDIMILVKSRAGLVEHLVRALKNRDIPVSGIDRMVLSTQIAVQDLMAAARFALQQEDDLSLAALLKSPLVGLGEEDLFKVAVGRSGSLWASVRDGLDAEIAAWLSALIVRGGTVHPYEFFSHILHHPCPADRSGSGMRAMMARLGADALDPLQEFLNATLEFEGENIPALQSFLHWQDQGESEIKREMESGADCVRIMTVHASKGLQAPIVILPDTVHGPSAIARVERGERILWATHRDLPLPLWSPRGEEDCPAYTRALIQKKDKLAQEYRRLLYVALTRAEDRLYIGGCRVRKANKDGSIPDIADGCWYKLARDGFKRLENEPGFESFIADPDNDIPGFRLSCPQSVAVKSDDIPASAPVIAGDVQDDWSWMDQTPPDEENPPRPLNPSRPAEAEPAARSPLDVVQDDGLRFRRGNLTHALLQLLPGIDPARRGAAARDWLARQGISDSLCDGIYNEVFAILDHPDFAPLFGPGSMAEVPITGLVNGRLVSGQIDRLLITDDCITIVDYKTNRPPPTDPADIPALYRSQMKAYADTLAVLYPGRVIRTYLLWTDGAAMVEIR